MSMLQKLNNFVVETSEQALRVVEEGSALLMGTAGGNDAGENVEHAPVMQDAEQEEMIAEMLRDGDLEDLPEGLLSGESPLNGLAEGVLDDIIKNQAAPRSTWDNIQGFKAAITWSEPLIVGIIFFHFMIAFSAYFATKKGGLPSQLTIMSIIFIVVRCAEKINDAGRQHWEDIASQNYFDRKGIFISIMVSAPLLLVSACMLIGIMREASSLLIEVKKRELKAKAKKSKRAKKSKSKKND
ncbi:hypothetical protein CTEN210_13743 [Chaetoceros tenuissimus]|uniref:Transmembrane protein 18 n=1 Tax=Chaetoceros tenuissimus TaxID=426638 RepID=A0AAD3D3L1_9STRA|nr:hypothetical protein CTEN210_13743 [Chaetoceros tenuissimus]